MTPTQRLRRAIRHLMRERWVRDDPGPECFDADEGRMGALLAFIGGSGDAGVRGHLVDCVRCRHLYAHLRRAETVAGD